MWLRWSAIVCFGFGGITACGGRATTPAGAPDSGAGETAGPDDGADAPFAVDSGAEAGLPDGSDSGPPPAHFCAQNSALQWCEDWDKSTTPSNAWTLRQNGGGAFAVIETINPISPPNILHGAYGTSAKTGDTAFLSRSVKVNDIGNWRTVEIDFDTRFDSVSPTATLAFLEVEGAGGGGSARGHLTVSLASGHIRLSSQTEAPGQKSAQTPGTVSPDSTYHGKLTLSLQCVGSCGEWNGKLDLGNLGSLTVVAGDIGQFGGSVDMHVNVGVLGSTGFAAGDTADVRVDNIVAN